MKISAQISELQADEMPGAGAGDQRHFVFGKDDKYEIQIARTIEQRLRAWALVYKVYRGKGYAQPNADNLWYGLHDALPNTTTLLVTREGEDVAALTVVFDSPLGLPADHLYRDELDELRRKNHRLCEMISLVSSETSRSRCMEIICHMFKFAYVTAKYDEGATVFVVTVNPSHVAYYERKLFFRRRGGERSYGKVGGAPAVLLWLDLTNADTQYETRNGQRFVEASMLADMLRLIARDRRPMDPDTVKMWFEDHRPLLPEAPTFAQEYLRSHYASSDLRSRDAPATRYLEPAPDRLAV